MRRLEELDVWRLAMDFAERVYRFIDRYPSTEIYRLTDQTCRAAISVAANIGEGWGRGTPGQFRFFLRVAAGSAAELETHLLLAARLGYVTAAELQPLLNELHRIQRMIGGLLRTLTRSTSGPADRMPRPDPPAAPGSGPNASRRGSRRD